MNMVGHASTNGSTPHLQEVGADGFTVGERIKELRLAAGLSQRDLAARGASYAYISRVEAGTRTPSAKALRLLAPKLGVTSTFLEFGEETSAELRAAQQRIAQLERKVAQLERRLTVSQQRRQALREELVDALALGGKDSR